jgi:hypothetical protein
MFQAGIVAKHPEDVRKDVSPETVMWRDLPKHGETWRMRGSRTLSPPTHEPKALFIQGFLLCGILLTHVLPHVSLRNAVSDPLVDLRLNPERALAALDGLGERASRDAGIDRRATKADAALDFRAGE